MRRLLPQPATAGRKTTLRWYHYFYPLMLILSLRPACASPATPPWYFGMGIGQALLGLNKGNLANSFTAATSASSFNHDDFTFAIYAGYFLDPLLALELGYARLGNVITTSSGASTKLFNTDTFYVDTVLLHRYNKNAAIYAKVGAHFWDIAPDSGSSISNGTDLMLGTGIELNIYGGSNRMARVELMHYQFDKVYLDSTDTLTLNLVFKY